MAWRRDKAKGRDGSVPPSRADADGMEMLPVIQEDGSTQEREALGRIKRAEADLRRLERREAKARRREERETRARDRRIAAMRRSRDVGPVALMAVIATMNGVAAFFLVLSLWWPDWPLYDPILLQDSVHWELVTFSFVVVSVVSVILLERRPSPAFIVRAQYALGTYIGLGLVATFCGLLLAHVLVDMELMDVDWVFWMWVVLFLATGSSMAMTIIYAVAHRTGSRAFLTVSYHRAMGTVSAALLVSLLLLPFLFLPHMGWMYEVGVSMYYVGWLMFLFPLPAVAAAFAVKKRSEGMTPRSTYA